MKAIAEQANMTPAGMYYYFENKQALLYACLEQAIVGLTEECSRAEPESRTQIDALRSFVKTHITYQLDRIASVATVYTRWVYASKGKSNHLKSSQQRKLRGLERIHLNNLREILTVGCVAGDFDVDDVTLTSFAIIGMCEHVLTWAATPGELSSQEIGDRFADYAVRLVGAV